MKNFKTKDLMIGIQQEKSPRIANLAHVFNEDFMEGYNFGACDGDSVGPKCAPGSECLPPSNKRYNKGADFSNHIINLADLKNMLAKMQINSSTTLETAAAV